jgi:hypothetical protein
MSRHRLFDAMGIGAHDVVKTALISLALGAIALSGCVSTEATLVEAEALQEAPVRFMGMPPIEEAAQGGRTVVRVFTVDDGFWPVVEFVAGPDGSVRVSATNVPGAFGARRISANVDPELWKIATEDLAELRSGSTKDEPDTITLDVAALSANGIEATMICAPVSWFVVADGKGVATPGMPAWNSCANRQAGVIPGLYGLALHSLPPCGALEPASLDVASVSRCLRLLGRRDVALEVSNQVALERAALPEGSDDLPLILAHFGPAARFQIRGSEPVTGPDALKAAWGRLALGHELRIGLSTYQGLSDTEVEVRGEAYYGIDRDLSGRILAPADRELWFAAYHQVWAKTGIGWSIREFVIDRPVRSYGSDPMARYLETIALNNSARR